MIRARSSLLLVHALAGLAMAEEAAHHHAPSVVDLLWPVLNFGLFTFLIYRFAWPMVKTSVGERRDLVVGEIAEAERSENEARAELVEIERLRATQKEEGERILRQLREEGERERAAIVEAARRSGERIRIDARRLGEQEAAQAALQIRRAVAAEAVRRAEAALRQRLGEGEQRRFVAEFLMGVQREVSR